MNFLAILKLIVQMLPIIHAAVDQIDDVFPASGQGTDKLALLKTMIEKSIAISDVGSAFAANPAWSFEMIWPLISGTVANVVATKKAIAAAPTVYPAA
jgi:hypothetical protein